MLKEFDFCCTVDLQIFLSIDPFLLNEVAVGLLDLVFPEIFLHTEGVLCAVSDLPKEANKDQVDQDAGPVHLHAETTKRLYEILIA